MAFLENTEELYQWSNLSENDIYLQGNSYKYAMNNSSLEWNNATGQYNEHQGYMNAVGGCPGHCDPPQVMDANCNCVDGATGQVTAGDGSGCITCGLGSTCTAPATCQGGCCIYKLTEGARRPRNSFSNAGGDPSINVGGETFDMQPTLAWNQGDFFGQPQGFGSSPTACAPCPQGFQGDRQSCGGAGCYNSLGQRMYESGTGIPPGMGVQYTQI